MPGTQYLDEVALRAIVQTVHSPALIERLRATAIENSPVHGRGAFVAFAGRLRVAGQLVPIHVGLNSTFPLSLPLIHVLEPQTLGAVPHVLADGFVCYTQPVGLLLDRHNPVGMIQEAIDKAVDVLERGLGGENQNDLVDEFEAYWRQLVGLQEVPSFVTPASEPREVMVATTAGSRDGYAIVSDDLAVVRAYYNGATTKQGTILTALYIPLNEGVLVVPPISRPFWSLSEFQTLVHQNLSPWNLRRLRKLTTKHKREEVVILALPRPQGGEVLFGVHCVGVEKAHPLAPGGTVQKLSPLLLKRHDKPHLLLRSGANTGLSEKKVALIGCGSVGGFVALELVRLGVLNLTLVDPDDLSIDNTFRHVLGKEGVGKKKVLLAREDIKRKFPYVQITAIPESAEHALATGMLRPQLFDLIIVAVGDMTVNLHLNHLFYDDANMPPVLYTWAEAYGIGGHALLTLNRTRMGCVECLVTPMANDDGGVVDRSSFAASGQNFTININGCATAFTPFGSLDALRTTALAVQLAGEALMDRMDGNSLRSWKGNSREFVHAGYRLSSRYNLSMEALLDQQDAFYNARCRVCGQSA